MIVERMDCLQETKRTIVAAEDEKVRVSACVREKKEEVGEKLGDRTDKRQPRQSVLSACRTVAYPIAPADLDAWH